MKTNDWLIDFPGRIYKVPFPQVEYTTGRKLRTSPIHSRLEGLGAYFGETMAYERPMWFSPQNQGEQIIMILGLNIRVIREGGRECFI